MINKDLIEFAETFSENYFLYPVDFYYSADKKHTIDYQNSDVFGSGKRNFSVGLTSGDFIFSKDKLIDFNKNFVYYMVIWLAIHKKLPGEYEVADGWALEHYKTTNRDKKDIMDGWLKVMTNTPLNQRRNKYYISWLKKAD